MWAGAMAVRPRAERSQNDDCGRAGRGDWMPVRDRGIGANSRPLGND